MSAPGTAPTADEFFGGGGGNKAALPSADEFFAPPPPSIMEGAGAALKVGAAAITGSKPDVQSSAELDQFIAKNPLGRVLSAFGQGAEQAWGSDPVGLSPETTEFLTKSGVLPDYSKGRDTLSKAFNEAWIRPAAAALDATMRAGGALISGAEGAVRQTGVETGQPLLGQTLSEMTEYGAMRGDIALHPLERGQGPLDLARARSLGVIGEGEGGFTGAREPTQLSTVQRAEAVKAAEQHAAEQARATGQPEPPARSPEEGAPITAETVPTPPAAPDIHAVARQIAPDTFREYDAISAQRDTFRASLNERAAERAQLPEAQELQNTINTITGKVAGVEDRLTNKARARLEDARDDLDAFLRTDTSEMATIRKSLMEADYRMRDLAPDVSAAYREAQKRIPQEAADELGLAENEPERAAEAQRAGPVELRGGEGAPAPGAVPVLRGPESREASPGLQPSAENPLGVPGVPPDIARGGADAGHLAERGGVPGVFPEETARTGGAGAGESIAADVSRKLVAAGRSKEEADAAGAVVQARYETRAARFRGKLGTAKELYEREGPNIVRGRGAAPRESMEGKTAASPPPKPANPVAAPSELESLDPAAISIDAARFQFKAGTGEGGVSDRLQGVEQWDPRMAGTALVWRDGTGKDWIADGHQRLGLAQRLAAQGQTGIRLNAFVLNAREGITDADARAIAAAKNIAEGTGTAIDAAKIMRDAAERGIELPAMPPRSALVRDGQALARLSPDAFGMAVNEVVPTNQAAMVGRLVDDPLAQTEAMRVLAKAKPENARQAELIIREMLASGVEEMTKQGGLFGDEHFAASIVLERAKIADEAMRQLGRDEATFKSLVKEAERIEAHGQNVLDEAANKARLTTDEQAHQFLTHLATRKGPVSDALNGIARRVKSGDISAAAGAREFLGTVRAKIEEGVATGPDFSRPEPGATAEFSQSGLKQGELEGLPGETADEKRARLGRLKIEESQQLPRAISGRAQKPADEGLFGRDEKAQRSLFQAAFHGSPYDFEQFRNEHIGAGEGAQMYGFGHYFAGKREVAEYYKKQLSGDRKGHLYSVDLAPKEDEWLDRDKPMSQQSPVVQERLKAAGLWDGTDMRAPEFYADLARRLHDPDLYDPSFAFHEARRAASEALRKAGVPGIRYADMQSRLSAAQAEAALPEAREKAALAEKGADVAKRNDFPDATDRADKAAAAKAHVADLEDTASGKKTNNFVVFDPAHIKILEKEYYQDKARAVTDTPEFKNWFRDSAATNDDGSPRVMYHGSNRRFSEFSPQPSVRRGDYGGIEHVTSPTFFFGEHPDTARVFAKDKATIAERLYGKPPGRAEVRPFYLSVQSPLDFGDGPYPHLDAIDEVERLTGYTPQTWEDVQRILDDPRAVQQIRGLYDGVRLKESDGSEAWGVFEPTQIKSTRNRGEFDPANNSIYEQSRRGSIALGESRATIRMMKDADASTFMHEEGHDWLEQMMRDAAHPEAPDDIRSDAQTIRDWLGTKEGAEIPTAAHEKFARGFERYLMEGVAPSRALASVFAKFKNWLTQIYKTVQALRSPISDDIRAVFDRMLATEPERAVIAPEREAETALADLHEHDAATTPPEHAALTADTMRGEIDARAKEVAPEVHDELPAKAEAGGIPRQDTNIPGRGNAPGTAAAESGGPAGTGAEPAGGDEAAAKGFELRGEPGGGARKATGRGTGPAPAGPNARIPEPESDLVDKAGNIRVENLNTTHDVDRLIHEMSDENEGFASVRQPVSDASALDLADAMGLRPQDLNLDELQKFSRAHAFAVRKLFVATSTEANWAAVKAATGTDNDVLAYAEARSRLRMVQQYLSGLTYSAGSMLRGFQKLPGTAEAKNIAQVMGDLSQTRDLFQLKLEAKRLARLNTPAKVAKYLADADKPGLGEMGLELFINNLISGPITHATYATGNTLLALWKAVPETFAEAAIGATREALTGTVQERAYFGEVGAQLYAMFGKGQRDGFRALWDSLKAGQTTALPGEMAADSMKDMFSTERTRATTPFTSTKAIPNFEVGGVPIPLGSIIRAPGERMVAPIHSYYRTVGYVQGIARQAYRQAVTEGLTGDALSARIVDLTANPPEPMMETARHEATDQTLMGQGGELMRRVSGLLNYRFNLPVLGQTRLFRFIDPFVQIFGSMMRETVVKRGPVGILAPSIRDDLMGKNGPLAQNSAGARIAMGVGLSAVGAGLAAEGLLTPSAPSDPRARGIWTLVNGLPHSIRVGEMSYDLSRLGVVGMQLGIAADLYHVAGTVAHGDAAKAGSLLVHSIAQNFLDEGFAKGISDILKAVDDNDRYGPQWARNFAKSFVPYSVGLAQVARQIDPVARQARTATDTILAGIPFASESLEPRRDIWGEPVQNRDWAIVYSQRLQDDPVNRELLSLGIFPGQPTRKIRGVPVTDAQYDDLSRIGGRYAKMLLDNDLATPGWSDIPAEQRIEIIKKDVEMARETARTTVMMNDSATAPLGQSIIDRAVALKTAPLQGPQQ